jgi:hypothetical protein
LSCLGKTGIVWDGIWRIGTGRTEHNFKLGDQRLNVSLADKTSIRSLGRKHTKN